METVTRIVVNPDTNQYYMEQMPRSEDVRQAILEIDFPKDGIAVKDAASILAKTFSLSGEQIKARNSSNLNFFRHNVVSPQFKYLLEAGKLKQPKGPRTPYFLTGSSSESSDTELRETSLEYGEASAIEKVERTALNPDTEEEYQIELPATPVVKPALLDFDYPASGIRIRDIAEALADQFGLTNEERTAKFSSGLVWRHHVNVTANDLVNSRQLLRIRRGWIINPEQPDIETAEDSDATSPFSDREIPPPAVVIARNYQEHQNQLKEELLQKIMGSHPDFFEELVLELLIEMGYGRSRADAEVLGRSGDGGIDGIIKEDELGLHLIYIQAKRQKENVSVHLVRDFAGALDCKGAQKGVFLTTSNFTQPAKNFVEEVRSRRIILIDGAQLVRRMIDHNLGVSAGNFYQLKEVDPDYFATDETVDTIDDAVDAD